MLMKQAVSVSFILKCPKCYDPNQHNPLFKKRMGELHSDTMLKEAWLKDNGWQLTTKWECQFVQETKENEELQQFLNELNLDEPLEPRSAFFGGRTNAAKLYHRCSSPGEKIKYGGGL